MVKKKPNAEQAQIEGMESEKNPKVEKSAKWYVKQRDARMVLTRAEKEAKETLLGTMTEEGLTDYEYKGLAVHVDVSRNVKVQVDGKPGEQGEEAE